MQDIKKIKLFVLTFILFLAGLMKTERACALNNPLWFLTVGASTNTNIFNNASEISDKLTDVNLRLLMANPLSSKMQNQIDISYKQDWKSNYKAVNSRLFQGTIRFLYKNSNKSSSQSAFVYQDYGIYTSPGINLVLQRKISGSNFIKFDYTIARRTFTNPNLDGNNHLAKLDYILQKDPKTQVTPYYQFEMNTSATPSYEYKGHTLGVRYAWNSKKKVVFSSAYDYRVRNYDTPAVFKGILSTRQERRHQLNLGVNFMFRKNAAFILKYIYYKNEAASDNPLYVKDKAYKVHVFSFAVSVNNLKTPKSKKNKEEEEKDVKE